MPRSNKLLLLVLSLVFFCVLSGMVSRCLAGTMAPRHYGAADGLVSATLYSILQDQRGFLWIASDNGVYRFDGQSFVRFSASNGLPDNDILGMWCDPSGRLWLACYNAEPCYIEEGRIFSGNMDQIFSSMRFQRYIRFIRPFRQGVVFKEDANPVLFFLTPDGRIEEFAPSGDFLLMRDYYLLRQEDSLKLFDLEDKQLDVLYLGPLQGKHLPLGNLGQNAFFTLWDGKVHLFSVAHDRLVRGGSRTMPFSVEKRYFLDDRLWVETRAGALTPVDAFFRPLWDSTLYLGNVTVNTLFKDHQGGYWIGTKGDGLVYLPPGGMQVLSEADGLVQNNIACSDARGGSVFVVTGNSHVQEIGPEGVRSLKLDLSNRCPGRINTLQVSDHYIVCGSDQGYLCSVNRRTGQIRVSHRLGSIKDIEDIGGDRLLLATSGSTVIAELPRHHFTIINAGRASAAQIVGQNQFCIGRVKGLDLIHAGQSGQGNGQGYASALKHPQLQASTINDIQFTDSLMVLSTAQQGVFLVSPSGIVHLTVADGLTDNNCQQIAIDSGRNIWIGSTSGLNVLQRVPGRMKPEVGTITSFNGLAPGSIRNIHFVQGQVMVTGSGGISVFPNHWFSSGTDTPDVHLSSVIINGVPRHVENGLASFPSDSNNVQFVFSAIDYTSLGQFRYSYRLRGLSDRWIQTTNKTISIDRLGPGEYVLELKAMNARKVWSARMATFRFRIRPAWHEEPLNRMVAAAGLLALVFTGAWYFNRRRFRNRLAQQAMQQHVAEVELKALKAQINPHFIFNTLNAIQFFIHSEDNEKADLYLNKMSQLIRATLTFSNEGSILLRDEIQYLRNYLDLESLRFNGDFEYRLDVASGVLIDRIHIPAMVVQPHVENAIRHGLKPKSKGAKWVHIRFRVERETLVCEVEDNGIGRAESRRMNKENDMKHSSQGEDLSRSKLAIYQQLRGKSASLHIEDKMQAGESSGTLVTLKIEL